MAQTVTRAHRNGLRCSKISVHELASVSDPRVDPLTQTTWSQETANEDDETACYNYYTPPYAAGNPNNYPCGCVATAMAQLMCYWQYPIAGVGTASFPITINGQAATGNLRGGDGNGDSYQWANMPLRPTSGIPTTQCQAIGAICSDAGVAAQIEYDPYDSNPHDNYVAQALTSVFYYGNAIRAYANASDFTANLPNIVNPDLDAGYPVLFGILSTEREWRRRSSAMATGMKMQLSITI